MNLVIPEDKAAEFRDQGYKVLDKDEGPTIVMKRKVNGPNGMVRPAPILMDSSRTPIDLRVGNGSKVKVQYKPWEISRNGTTYRGLDFQGMQVLNLKTYTVDGDEFDIEDEEEISEL